MAVRKAEAVWQGTLKEGGGSLKLGSGAWEGPYDYRSRFEEGDLTNPEELIGAAHAGCFAMFLSAQLSGAGFPPSRVHATANVTLGRDDVGPVITGIVIDVDAEVPGVDQATFDEKVVVSKANCPISRALASVPMTVNATLKK